ncbi:hypothetical protein BDV12DRAFT_159082, partial [Aspergillus spectabilis]
MLSYDEYSPIKDYLKRIEQQAIEMGNQHGKLMQTQHDQLRDTLIRLEAMRVNNAAPSHLASCHNAINDIRSSLATLRTSASQISRENEILRALNLPNMFRRDDSIDPAIGNTYRWLVEDDELSQSSDERESQGIYSLGDDSEENGTSSLYTHSTIDRVSESRNTVSPGSQKLKENETDSQEETSVSPPSEEN